LRNDELLDLISECDEIRIVLARAVWQKSHLFGLYAVGQRRNRGLGGAREKDDPDRCEQEVTVHIAA